MSEDTERFLKEIERLKQHIAALERANKEMEQRLKISTATTEGAPTITSEPEYHETIERLVTKVGGILQGEKCLIVLHDKQSDELYAVSPALNIPDEQIRRFRISPSDGVIGRVYETKEPANMYDVNSDSGQHLEAMGVKNGVVVPLTVEKRDPDTNKLTETRTIGALCVFNKRFGNIFAEEDIRLLTVMARNTAAVIANAQVFFEVVEQKKELESAIESIVSGLVTVAANGHVLQINSAGRKIFGLDSQEVQGRPFDEVIANAKVQEMIRQCLTHEAEVFEEITIPDPEERIYQAQTALMHSEENAVIGAVAIFNDITDIRSVERMKTAFVSTVSHELRTPLTSIKGFISTLLQDTEGFYDRDTQREFYQIIDSECDRLTRLINDLLNVSRIESGRALDMNMEPCFFPEIVEKVLTIQRSYATSHTLVSETSPEVGELVGDRDKLEQILINIINNAIKYSPRGGEVKVKSWLEDDMLYCSISDQGMGIPKEHLPRVFDRFHRVDQRDTRKIYGTGLGLFLVKHFIESHHGEIWVDSEVGVGTSFTFRIPLTQPEEDEKKPE